MGMTCIYAKPKRKLRPRSVSNSDATHVGVFKKKNAVEIRPTDQGKR